MIKLNIMDDTDLLGCFRTLISGMLPHENYNDELFAQLLNSSFKYVHLEEMNMEYYVLFSVLKSMHALRSAHLSASIKVYREVVDTIAQTQLYEWARDRSTGITEWLLDNGLPDDLSNELNLATATQKLYQNLMMLYDECYDMAVPSEEAFTVLPAYLNAFLNNASESLVNTQREILTTGCWVGKRRLMGPVDNIEYTKSASLEIYNRAYSAEGNLLAVDSIEASDALIESASRLFIPLADYGMPHLDDITPMLRHRLVTLTGNEGVGKTTIMINLIGTLLAANRGVRIMSGENGGDLLYVQILSNYIYHRTKADNDNGIGFQIPFSRILNPEDQTEAMARVIAIYKAELAERKLLVFIDTINYNTVYEELVQMYSEREFDAIFIDHSLTLVGKGTASENVTKLALAARAFKRKYPVFFCVLSQLSGTAKDSLKKGHKVTQSPTAESSALSRESDEIFVLSTSDLLRKSKLISLQVYKRRQAEPITPLLILSLNFNVSAFTYDVENQHYAEDEVLTKNAALEGLQATYDPNGSEDYDDDMLEEEEDEEDEDEEIELELEI